VRGLAAALVLALGAIGAGPGQPTSQPASQASEPGAPASPLRYVALGDSTAFGSGAIPGGGGYPPRLAQRLRDAGREVELTNLGVPGATAADLVDRVLPTLPLFKPTLVTIGIGLNDVAAGRSPADFAAAFDALCASALATGAAVVAVNIPDLLPTPSDAGRPPDYLARTRALNAEITRVAAARGVAVVDLFTESQRRLPGHPEYSSADGFHPSAAGYELWADVMWPAVRQAAATR
jgi:lysophospholipase L1-like esterase